MSDFEGRGDDEEIRSYALDGIRSVIPEMLEKDSFDPRSLETSVAEAVEDFVSDDQDCDMGQVTCMMFSTDTENQPLEDGRFGIAVSVNFSLDMMPYSVVERFIYDAEGNLLEG